MRTLQYRLAHSGEAALVLSLLRRIDHAFPIPLSRKTELAPLADKFLANGLVYMALDGENAVGMLGFYANDTLSRQAYFSVLGVDASYRGQGIARKLLEDALAICKEAGMTVCTLYTHKTNLPAIRLYGKLGFCAQEDPGRPEDIKFIKEL